VAQVHRRSITRLAAAGAAVAIGGAAVWWRRNPSACPYSQRFWVEAPHPLITRSRLVDALDPHPGERILEVGPGTGYYSFEVARRVGDGTLELVDLQQEMLDHVMREAAARGVSNLEPTRADARSLPYEDDRFDAAFLVTVLGEIPDQSAALRELRRVVRPGGRVVVGELLGDPHMVTFGALGRRASAAGLEVERRIGPRVGYFARLRVGSADRSPR
jgi:ubiquinone/menaquinone biosynthesis C-methylase UbiE